ncbi:MAG: PHP domain-containing protein [Gemmatimonadota bacterium]
MVTEVDVNGRIAALLRDLALVQKSTQSGWGYKRAADAVFDLDRPVTGLAGPSGSIARIPNVGPKSEQVIREVLESGGSPTVEKAVAASEKAAEVRRRRGLRENFLSRSQVGLVLGDRTIEAVGLADHKCDFQMHSVWSDGSQTLDEIVDGCLDRGYNCCAVTDHSRGLKVAGGMTTEEMAGQQKEIDRVNRRNAGSFRMFKGLEANILADGSIDMLPGELQGVELLLAAPHSGLRLDTNQTTRMLTALETPGLHILGHPRGRMYGSRAGVSADWDAVFVEASRRRVAIEIDGDPARQDIDHVLARRALAAGCIFALDSDAHSVAELRYVENAIAHARLAGIPRERVINCWSLEKLGDWLAARSAKE